MPSKNKAPKVAKTKASKKSTKKVEPVVETVAPVAPVQPVVAPVVPVVAPVAPETKPISLEVVEITELDYSEEINHLQNELKNTLLIIKNLVNHVGKLEKRMARDKKVVEKKNEN
jgi:hypothetical protein